MIELMPGPAQKNLGEPILRTGVDLALGINVWFFLTPIIYPLSMIQSDSVKAYFLLNPMHSFVNLYREIVLRGELPLINLQIVIVVSLVSYLFGGWLFMRIKHAFGDVL